MKILIIGKNGFVGKSLSEYFLHKSGIHLDAVSHQELDLLEEAQVDKFFENKYYDAVINAAVWSPLKNEETLRNMETENDLRMYLNLSRHADKCGKLIYFGSGAEYNKEYDLKGVTEKDLPLFQLPKTSYGFAKYVINELVQSSDNIYNLRIFGLYGINEDYRYKFITGACAKAALDLPISIRQNVYFDYLYIDDFCEMVDRFIQLRQPKYHTYNITSGKKIDLLTLAEMIREISRKSIEIIVCRQGLGKEYTANNERLLEEIGNIEFTAYEDAIKVLYQYFEGHKNKIDITPLVYQ